MKKSYDDFKEALMEQIWEALKRKLTITKISKNNNKQSVLGGEKMNLSQLKKKLQKDTIFKIKEHRKKEFNGQIRKVNKVQTNGIYTVVDGEPENPVSMANGGKGYWLKYGKASNWEFKQDTCYLYQGEPSSNNFIMSFVIVE